MMVGPVRSRDSKLPKHVYKQVVKGRTYYRFRLTGARLPEPGTPAFYAAYAKLIAEPKANLGRYDPGSVAHTIDMYQRSAEFGQLAEATQRDYRRYLARLDRSIGDHPIDTVDTNYVLELRDKLRETPVAANHAVAVIGALFRFAITRRLVSKDITSGIPRLKGGDGYRRWTDEEIEQFNRGGRMELALALGLYLGQRLSDVIKLAWSDYDGARIKLRQQKTGTSLVIPVHPDLKKLLRGGEGTILKTRTGLPYHPRVFSRDFLDARVAAGLPDDLSFHGLRHTAASRLAELGAGAPEIQSITGHKSLQLVEHYIRQANQEKQAERAIDRLAQPHVSP